MNRLVGACIVIVTILVSSGRAQQTLAGDWVLTLDDGFTSPVMRLSLIVTGEKLTGTAGGQPIEGTVRGGSIEFTRQKAVAKGALEGGALKGDIVFPDRTAKWTAVRIPPAPQVPRTHEFEPSSFHLYFSSKVTPALRIHPGDTVRTWSVDAGGRDPKGNRRSAGGNPQTGPFYVEGAMPNDTLVVRLNRLRTNRDWAQSGSSIMRNALEPGTLDSLKWDPAFNSRWRIDATRNLAFLESPTPALKDFTVPLLPMLGCIAVAPQGDLSIRTTDSGRFGGNMDYNQIREGTTVYLPVSHPGALLFVGDGHAARATAN